MYESASIVRAFSWVNFTPANCTGFIARVIFVMIVILKGFPDSNSLHLEIKNRILLDLAWPKKTGD